MRRGSVKNKLYLAVFVWTIACAAMFFYVFGLLQNSNQTLATGIVDQKKSLDSLKAEQNSYMKGKEDLVKLSKEQYQPESFFTKDVSLVNEIKTLEDIGAKNNVTLVLGGLSGTVGSASKAGTLSDISAVPYSLSIIGSLPNVVDTLKAIENLGFVTTFTNINVTAAEGGSVNTNLTAYFYLKKN